MDQLLQAGPQPNPPGPTTPVFNPLLEDKMAAIENALQSLLLSRGDGLDKLAVQLPQDDSLVKDAIGDGLKFGVGKMLDAMTDGIAAVLTVYSSGLISAFAAGGAHSPRASSRPRRARATPRSRSPSSSSRPSARRSPTIPSRCSRTT